MDEEEVRLPEELASALRALLGEIAGQSRPNRLLELAEDLQARLDQRHAVESTTRRGVSGPF